VDWKQIKMVNMKKAVGYILGLIGVLMLFGQGGTVQPILGLGFNVSVFHITVEAVVSLIAAYYLIR
jgi:hypothetical protein